MTPTPTHAFVGRAGTTLRSSGAPQCVLGCGRVQCNDDTWFILCNYDPPGNHIGQRPYGVNPDTDSNHLCILAID